MNHSKKKGFSFGLTSGVITTLGLIIGLHSGTHSSAIVLGGILVIAVADAFSDALGIHISEEFEGIHNFKEIWEATIVTFLSKFIFSLTFAVPILFLNLYPAIIASVIWGMSLIIIFSYYMAVKQNVKPAKVIAEHLFIAITVIFATHYIGDLAAKLG